jgi:hypothetical protein
MLQRLRTWFRKQCRDAQRDIDIQFKVSIPYTEANEVALRGLTIGLVELRLYRACDIIANTRLEGVKVKCVSNPDWRN